MENTSNKTSNNSGPVLMMTLVAMFAAVGAVTSWISIPLPSGIPVTLQTFGIALIGYTLGWKYGLLSVAVYIVLGAIGVPVFSGFKSGLGTILGPTGGFIIGFLFLAALCGVCRLGVFRKNRAVNIAAAVVFGLLGLAATHLLGTLQFMYLQNITFVQAALTVSVGYLIKDIVSVIAAYFLSLAAVGLIEKISRRKI